MIAAFGDDVDDLRVFMHQGSVRRLDIRLSIQAVKQFNKSNRSIANVESALEARLRIHLTQLSKGRDWDSSEGELTFHPNTPAPYFHSPL